MNKKIVLITGASQGIGAEIAKAFSKLNNVVLLLLARTEKKLKEVAENCSQQGAEAHYFVCDVTDANAVKNVAQIILSRWPALDVLVNNAGYYQSSSFMQTSVEDFKAQVDANLTSSFLVTQAFLASMLAKKSGDIFFMCSIASLQGYADSPAYCAAKHGLLGLARTLRETTKQTGIRVTSIMPGAVLTPAWSIADPLDKRFIPAHDIAKVVIDLHALDHNTNVEEIVVRPRLGDVY